MEDTQASFVGVERYRVLLDAKLPCFSYVMELLTMDDKSMTSKIPHIGETSHLVLVRFGC